MKYLSALVKSMSPFTAPPSKIKGEVARIQRTALTRKGIYAPGKGRTISARETARLQRFGDELPPLVKIGAD